MKINSIWQFTLTVTLATLMTSSALASGGSFSSHYVRSKKIIVTRESVNVNLGNLTSREGCSNLRYNYHPSILSEPVVLFSDKNLTPSSCQYFYNYVADGDRDFDVEVTRDLQVWQNQEDGDIWTITMCAVSIKFDFEEIKPFVLKGYAADQFCGEE